MSRNKEKNDGNRSYIEKCWRCETCYRKAGGIYQIEDQEKNIVISPQEKNIVVNPDDPAAVLTGVLPAHLLAEIRADNYCQFRKIGELVV